MTKLRINPIVAEDLKDIKEYITEDNEEILIPISGTVRAVRSAWVSSAGVPATVSQKRMIITGSAVWGKFHPCNRIHAHAIACGSSWGECGMLNDAICFKAVYIVCGYTDLCSGMDWLAALIETQTRSRPYVPDTLYLLYWCVKTSRKCRRKARHGKASAIHLNRKNTSKYFWMTCFHGHRTCLRTAVSSVKKKWNKDWSKPVW